MCGIAGIYAYRESAEPPVEAELLRMRERMAPRGPDGEGQWISHCGRARLAHRRLAIIDLSEDAAQPMTTGDGRFTITFNGEIYNYRELRRHLEQRGYVFRTQSDTEVLLHLYADLGDAMVRSLRGMFAFAIWDSTRRTLFMARDHFGIKPLYYADDGSTIRFASQVKALLAGGAVDTTAEPAGAVGFLLWGCVPEPYTLYRNIKAVPAGATLTISPGRARQPEAYFSIRDELVAAQEKGTRFGSEDRGELGEALLDAVAHNLVADVPVGVFLSAGVDSTLIATLATKSGQAALRTLTLGFSEYRGGPADEVPTAEKTASLLGTSHETHWISGDDFRAELPGILHAMDQPTTDGVNSYFVCRAAARSGIKVAMSGLGGDELFGGYPSFAEIPKLNRLIPSGRVPALAGRLGRKAMSPLIRLVTSPKYAGLAEYGGSLSGAYLLRRALFMPWEISESLDPDQVDDGLRKLDTLAALDRTTNGIEQDHARIAALEMSWYMRNQLLRDADWAGMAHSVEVRVPFVDPVLFRRLAPWLVSGSAPGKVDAASTPAAPLPRHVVSRRKSGFSVPVGEWIAGDMQARKASVRGLRGWAMRICSEEVPLFPRRSSRWLQTSLKDPAEVRRILVFRIGQLGDTVVSLPALWVIRRRYPNARITLLCDRQIRGAYVVAKDLLRDMDLVDDFEIYDADATGAAQPSRPWKMLKLMLRLSQRQFDLMVYLAPSARSKEQVLRDRRFFATSGIHHFVGLPDDSSEPERPGKPPQAWEADRILEHLAKDGITIPAPGQGCMDLQLGSREERVVDIWTGTLPADGGRPWLGIGPGSKMPAKRWPVERYAEVVASLIKTHDIWPVVFGGLEDRVLGDGLIAAWGRGYNAAGALDLRSSAAALRRCRFYVGNDTGTMHLAAAVGLPCVALFSARDVPGLWYPYGGGHAVLRERIECEGCGLVECIERGKECLTRITAFQALAECEKVLTTASPTGAPHRIRTALQSIAVTQRN